MSPRVTWKGSLNVSLVSLAVKAYTATAPENGQLRLNQLHAACHGRIFRTMFPIMKERALGCMARPLAVGTSHLTALS